MSGDLDGNNSAQAAEAKGKWRQRDRLTLKLLGFFFVAFGGLVWLGLFWEQSSEGRIVNAVAGLVLALAGAACWLLRRGKS